MGRASVPTPTLYPAFFFVLEKGSKSAGDAVISTLLMHRSYGLRRLWHKRPTFAFVGKSEYTLAFANRIAHSGLHAETGGVSNGGAISTLGAFCAVRKPCVARCQNGVLCRFWGLVMGAPKERREPSGQRCAYARRCSEAPRPRWAAQFFCASAKPTRSVAIAFILWYDKLAS